MNTFLRKVYPALVLAAAASFAVIATIELYPLVDRQAGLAGMVDSYIDDSGVKHPLTAVLLNFRGYDTLLEIGVLLIAVLAMRSLSDTRAQPNRLVPPFARYTIMRASLGVLLPVGVVAAGYMVWVGAYRPGGAFQAGVVLGALWVVLQVTGVVRTPLRFTRRLRLLLGIGFLMFLSAALLMGLVTGELLAYPAAYAGTIILAIESALSLSIGASIGVLFGLTFRSGITGDTAEGEVS